MRHAWRRRSASRSNLGSLAEQRAVATHSGVTSGILTRTGSRQGDRSKFPSKHMGKGRTLFGKGENSDTLVWNRQSPLR